MKIFLPILLTCLFLDVPAQVTVDGKLDSAEGYQLVYTNDSVAVNDWAPGFIVKVHYTTSQEKLYLFFEGGRLFHHPYCIYINVPSRQGVPLGQYLPELSLASWPLSNGTALGGFRPKMDFEVDYGLWGIRMAQPPRYFFKGIADYTRDTVAYERNLPYGVDTVVTYLADSTLGMAYKFNDSTFMGFPGNLGMEVEMDLAEFGINSHDSIEIFSLIKWFGGYTFTGNSIPHITNIWGGSVIHFYSPFIHFDTIPGDQFVRFGIGHAPGPVDGKLGIGYTLLSEYSLPTTDPNFGEPYGILKLYARQTPSHVYFLVAGTAEQGLGHFALYLDNPALNGIPSGQQLPAVDQSASLFQSARPVMDMETDFAFALSPDQFGTPLYAIDYTQQLGGNYQSNFLGAGIPDGTPMYGFHQADSGQAQFVRFDSMQSAYYETSNIYGNDGAIGWEFGIKKSALGITSAVDSIAVFAAYVKNNGAVWTNKVLPEVPGMQSDIGTNPNFNQLSGNQFVKYKVNDALNLVASTNGEKQRAVLKLFPNPVDNELFILNGKPSNGPATCRVRGLAGSVYTCNPVYVEGGLSIDVAHLPNGMYLATVQFGDEAQTVKFVVNR